MATYARRFIQHNVRVVGGCCGTTPEHIRQIKAAVRGPAPVSGRVSVSAAPAARPAPAGVAPIPREQKSKLAAALGQGRFVLGVELRPPRGFEAQATIERARALKARGVDVVNIPDGLRAGARLSALALAVLIEQQAGIETLLHYACRDRNLLGIQSDLLGAHAIGLRNVLLITGDPGRVGDYPGRDGGVRRRLDRPHQRRVASESWLRHRRAGNRRADGVSYRRVGQPIGA